ncbi:hypothetical protein GALL_139690 [mine drainage metagenome]|uniref:Uncharacterized protein n=1 Tax=mine drainage metagenome TaxID=410659 RepID=A0A1J5SI21_9ZZZZ
MGAGQLGAVVGVVGGHVGQCQHLPGPGIEHHDAARLGLVVDHRLAQVGVSEILDLVVQGQHHVLAVLRRPDRIDVLDDVAAPVLDDAAAAGFAGEDGLVGQLHSFLANVIGSGEAQDMGGDVAVRIIAAVLRLVMDAGQIEGHDPGGDIGRDLPLKIDKIAVAGELAVQLAHVHLQQMRQLIHLGRLQLGILGDGPDRLHRRRYRQHLAAAVHDPAARGRHLDHPGIALRPLLLQEGAVESLQIDRPAGQDREAGQDAEQQQPRAPGGQTLREQGAVGELHFASSTMMT